MLSTVFLKTLFEKRWMALWWTLGAVALTIFIVIFFPSLKDSFGQAIQNVPESLRSFVGNATDYETLNGYISVQVYQRMIYFPVILGVILATGLLGGDENEGTLQTLLTQPVSRAKVYVHKLAACAAIVGVMVFGLFAGSWLGSLLIHDHINLWRSFQAAFMTWLLTMTISVIGFALAAITGKRGLAGSIAGAFAFVTFLISSLVESVKELRYVDYASPFHYFNHPSPLKAPFDFGNMYVLLGVSIFFVILGYVFFVRRDVYQR